MLKFYFIRTLFSNDMQPKITDIIAFIETELADIQKQSSWDFSGKQVFTGDRTVKKIILSLDPSEYSIQQAIDKGCELLITHHPLFFRESKGISVADSATRRAVKAIRASLDILSYHTNLDIADAGTSAYICELLGADVQPGCLGKEGERGLFKLSVFVPYDHKEAVFKAMTESGAGSMGNYSSCGFMSEGVGMFTPNENAQPFIGKCGEDVIVDEVKLETIVDARVLARVVSALLEAHPYEHPAYDVIKLENAESYGFGKVATIKSPITIENFIKLIKQSIPMCDIRTNNMTPAPFDTFAVCTGSGASYWKECARKGIKVLLTGDMKYHDALDAEESGVCIVDAGHQATESVYMRRLRDILKNRFDVEVIIAEDLPRMISWG